LSEKKTEKNVKAKQQLTDLKTGLEWSRTGYRYLVQKNSAIKTTMCSKKGGLNSRVVLIVNSGSCETFKSENLMNMI